MKISPALSTKTLCGKNRVEEVAATPSSAKLPVPPFPATVVMIPLATVILRIR
jgi:hypothetical protein